MAGSLILYMWFLHTPYFHHIAEWSQRNIFILIPSIVLLKVVGIIWPPIPGGFATIAIIPITGFLIAYLTDLAGTIIGCCTVYFIGRKYGKGFLSKILGDEFANHAEKLKIKKGREIEALFVLRGLAAGVLVEAVSYGAGLIKMDFKKFLFGTVVSHIIIIGPSFLLYDKLYRTHNIYLIALSLVITMPILWKLRGRYFEDVVA